MEKNDDATIGANLRRLREERGLSQAEVARALSEAGLPGFHPQTITKIEKGVRSVKLAEGIPLARLLGVDPELLLEISESAISSAALHRALDKLVFSTGVAHNDLSAAVRDLLEARDELGSFCEEKRGDLRVEALDDAGSMLDELTVASAVAQGVKWHSDAQGNGRAEESSPDIVDWSVKRHDNGVAVKHHNDYYAEPGP